jgi:DDE family transposase
MINVKNHKQGNLFDPWAHLGPKRRKLLDESWAGLFREHILEELPVDELMPFFKEDWGRPTKELYTVMGAVLLQQAHDLTDEETIAEVAFNDQWHYALNITSESDDATYICPKTLYNIHRLFMDHDIDGAVFNKVTDKLGEVFDVDTRKQRLDSVHIKSNMARLGRIGIITKTIKKFLTNLRRQRRKLFDELDEELTGKYMTQKALSCFSMVKPSESANRLSEVAQDLFSLATRFSGNKEIADMTTFQLLLRVLREQCHVTESATGKPIEFTVRPSKEVSCESLQNPSDPDAGYDGHKGQGYQTQVMETYSDEQDPEQKARNLDLITYVEVEPASEHDANALVPAIESAQERGLGPEEVLADSHYGGDDNIAAAAELGVEVVAPAMPGAKKENKLGLEDFEFSEDGETLSCPAGHAPVKKKTNRKKGRHSAGFDSEKCSACSHAEDCPTKPGKNHRYLRYNNKEARLARRRAFERTPEFKGRYRMRAGVEATMSDLDRMTNIKRLRVRGMKAVRFAATLKATGVNIFRAASVKRARQALNPALSGFFSFILRPVYVFKERFYRITSKMTIFPSSIRINSQCEAQMPA